MKKYVFFIIAFCITGYLYPQISHPINCYGSGITRNVKIEAPSLFLNRVALQKSASVEIEVVTGEGFPSDAATALNYAASIYKYLLTSTRIIRIYAEWKDNGNQTWLAQSNPTEFVKDFSGGTPSFFYPITLAEKLKGDEINAANAYEITMVFDKDAPWYFNTDQNVPGDKYDFISVALHEIMHGLGFFSSFEAVKISSTLTIGNFGIKANSEYDSTGSPCIFDKFLKDNSQYLLDYGNSTQQLGQKLLTGPVWFTGDNTIEINASAPKILTTATWSNGSSLNHWDSSYFKPDNRNALMRPAADFGASIHQPGEVTLAVLEDMGWTINRLINFTLPYKNQVLAKGINDTIRWIDNIGSTSTSLQLYRNDGFGNYSIPKEIIFTGASVKGWNTIVYNFNVDPGDYEIRASTVTTVGVSKRFTISNIAKVADPMADLPNATYFAPVTARFTCATSGAKISYAYYRKGIDNPVEPAEPAVNISSLTLYANQADMGHTMVVKIKAWKDGLTPSNTVTYEYNLLGGVYLAQHASNGTAFKVGQYWEDITGWKDANTYRRAPFYVGSIYRIKASTAFREGTFEAFNYWTYRGNLKFINHDTLLMVADNTEGIAQFRPKYNATIRNSIEGTTGAYDQIYFKDPWYYDAIDNPYGTKNRGTSALFYSKPSPFNITTSDAGYKGVFLNQNSTLNPKYSVKAKSSFNYTINGVSKACVFANWSATGATVESPTSLETPVVFTATSNSNVVANYKVSMVSNSPKVFINNGQRNFYKGSNGILHIVYESMGCIWYQTSTDNGATWRIMNNGKPINQLSENGTCLTPSFDLSGNYNINIIYQSRLIDLGLTYVEFDYQTNSIIRTEGLYYPMNTNSFYTNPVIAVSTSGMLAIWRCPIESLLIYSFAKYNSTTGKIEWGNTQYMPGATTNSILPTIGNYENSIDFHIAWEQYVGGLSSSIKYTKMTVNTYPSFSLTFSPVETVSTALYKDNGAPSIEFVNSNPRVVWWQNDLDHEDEGAMVIYRAKSGSAWGSYVQYAYSDSIKSLNIRKSGNSNFGIAWSIKSGTGFKNYVSKNAGAASLRVSTDKYVQLSEANDLNMYLASIKYVAPFSSINTSLVNLGSLAKSYATESDSSSVSKYRAIHMEKDSSFISFQFGEILHGSNQIGFVEMNAEDSVNTLEHLNTYLESEEISVSDNSEVKFGVILKYNSSKNYKELLAKSDKLNFFIDVMDAQSGKVVKTVESIDFKGISEMGKRSYSLNLAGINSKVIKLKGRVESNCLSNVILADISYEINALKKIGSSNVISLNIELPTVYALYQNYPNPFNPSTTINYDLPEASKVTLIVYDILGREVANLVNEYREAGRYHVIFNASSLSSGIYIYQLKTNNYQAVKKMSFVK